MMTTFYLYVTEHGYGFCHTYTALVDVMRDGMTELAASGTLAEVLRVAAGL